MCESIWTHVLLSFSADVVHRCVLHFAYNFAFLPLCLLWGELDFYLQYELDGKWERMTTRQVSIAVHGKQPEQFTVRETVFGPVITDVPKVCCVTSGVGFIAGCVCVACNHSKRGFLAPAFRSHTTHSCTHSVGN